MLQQQDKKLPLLSDDTVSLNAEDSCFDVSLDTIRSILSELKVHKDPSKLKLNWIMDDAAYYFLGK